MALHMTMAQQMGVPAESFADSTGKLRELSEGLDQTGRSPILSSGGPPVDGSMRIQYDNDACYANCEGFVAKAGSNGSILDFGDLRRSGCHGCAAG